jgi:hypothetical protein
MLGYVEQKLLGRSRKRSAVRNVKFRHNGPFAKYQLSDGSPLVSMVFIDENVKFPLNIQYFLKYD